MLSSAFAFVPHHKRFDVGTCACCARPGLMHREAHYSGVLTVKGRSECKASSHRCTQLPSLFEGRRKCRQAKKRRVIHPHPHLSDEKCSSRFFWAGHFMSLNIILISSFFCRDVEYFLKIFFARRRELVPNTLGLSISLQRFLSQIFTYIYTMTIYIDVIFLLNIQTKMQR